MFLSLIRISINKGKPMPKPILIHWIDVMLQKIYNLSLVFDFWDMLE